LSTLATIKIIKYSLTPFQDDYLCFLRSLQIDLLLVVTIVGLLLPNYVGFSKYLALSLKDFIFYEIFYPRVLGAV